ncbi:MAG: hypothetical protein ABEJ76_08895 [Halanaeroarchaeum sp.]
MASDEDAQAAAAARRAERMFGDMPNAVKAGQPIGECPDCGSRFDYRGDTDRQNLDPCPECASQNWHKWGYRFHGEEIRRDEAWDEYDAPPEVDDDE